VALLGAIKADRSTLVALSDSHEPVRKSARNLESVTLVPAHQLTCFEMLNHRYLVITRADLEAFLKGPSSQIDKDAKINPLGREGARSAAAPRKKEAA
jgi:hypothetical protein